MYHSKPRPISEETMNWMLSGESNTNRNIIINRVNEAIREKERRYRIYLPNGDYYEIDNGQIIGSKKSA